MGTSHEKLKVLSMMTVYQAVATIEAFERAGELTANETNELLTLVRGADKEVAVAMMKAGISFLQNRYADEEVDSNYSYPDGYSVDPLVRQIETLADQLNFDAVSGNVFDLARKFQKQAVPVSGKDIEADGWKASVAWWTQYDTYEHAVEAVLKRIGDTRSFKNLREGKLGERHLRQTERTIQFERQLWEAQGENLFFFHPFQSGLWHRGKSVRRARGVFNSNEFGLGSFSNACFSLGHPKREVEWEQLHIDCAGDEYSSGGDGQFTDAPFVSWYDGRLRFCAARAGDAVAQCGSASGFAPQS